MCQSELTYSEEHKTFRQVLDLHILSLGADLPGKQNAKKRAGCSVSLEKKRMFWMARVINGTSWYSHGHKWAILHNNEWDYGGIRVTKLLSDSWDLNPGSSDSKACTPSPISQGGLSERFSPRQCRWLTSASNHCLRKERHQPGMVSQPAHAGAPCKAQGLLRQRRMIYVCILLFVVCMSSVLVPLFLLYCLLLHWVDLS